MEEVINERSLTERDVLNTTKLDNVGRVRKEGVAGFLDQTVVGDVNLVGIIDALADHAAEEEDNVKREDAEAKIMQRGLVHREDIVNGVIVAGKKNQSNAEGEDHKSNDRPNKDHTNTGAADMEHDMLVLLEINFWEVLGAARMLDFG